MEVSAKIIAEICVNVADDYFYKLSGSAGVWFRRSLPIQLKRDSLVASHTYHHGDQKEALIRHLDHHNLPVFC